VGVGVTYLHWSAAVDDTRHAHVQVAWDKGSYRCTITKTESWYESQVKELADLSSLL
jgi:hypothetical protein